jgi:hypothetical protein
MRPNTNRAHEPQGAVGEEVGMARQKASGTCWTALSQRWLSAS